MPELLGYILVFSGIFGLLEGTYIDDEQHPCYHERTCTWPPTPLECSYEFDVHWSISMSSDCSKCPSNTTIDEQQEGCIRLNGVPRPVIAVNGRIPGPGVHVCEGDTIKVAVKNRLEGLYTGTTVHWHGMHQRGTPDMDGTAGITQCSIDHGETFTYTFEATEPGTHFWHSHVALQRQDGMYGVMVVRQAKERDLQGEEYDFDLIEHTISVSDWWNDVAIEEFLLDNKIPDSLLINGKATTTEDCEDAMRGRVLLHVSQGNRYRFRVISNAATDCPMKISVDNHTLVMIASDGRAFKPVDVASFVIFSGERFDFVLDADQPIDSYWLRVDGMVDCGHLTELAVIRYEGANESAPTTNEAFNRPGTQLNPNYLEDGSPPIYVSQLESLESNDDFLNSDVRRIYIGMNVNYVYNTRYDISTAPQLDHISFLDPPLPPLRRHDEIDRSLFCDSSAGDENVYKECIYTIEVPLGQLVELVLVDEGFPLNKTHPMHMHGHSFQVAAIGKLGTHTTVEDVKLVYPGDLAAVNPPLKDTVMVPDGGYTAIRFKADNPGWWLFHCHFEYHTKKGMAMLIHVGNDEDLPPPPESILSTCSYPGSHASSLNNSGGPTFLVIFLLAVRCMAGFGLPGL